MGLKMLLAGVVQPLLVAALTLQGSAEDLHRPCPDFPLSFDLVSNFEVVVHGQIGEMDRLRFILDTGSSHSVIDRRVADRMRLHRHPGKAFNFDRDIAIEWANIPEVVIGPLYVADISMIVARLADISEFADSVDGIIGLDVLNRAHKIGIDYQRRRISFELDNECGSKPSAVKAFVITVAIQGVPMRLLVDTGSRYMLLYRDRLSSAVPHLRIEGEPRDGVIGRLQATRVNLPGVDVFREKAVTPVFLIEGSGKTDLGRIDGYLGPTSLHPRQVELDFAAMVLRWQ
jgi:gag-polyprotein putative aspartyl protease